MSSSPLEIVRKEIWSNEAQKWQEVVGSLRRTLDFFIAHTWKLILLSTRKSKMMDMIKVPPTYPIASELATDEYGKRSILDVNTRLRLFRP